MGRPHLREIFFCNHLVAYPSPQEYVSIISRSDRLSISSVLKGLTGHPLAASPVDIHRQALLISGSCKHAVAAGRGSYRLPVGAPGSDLSVTVTGFGLISTTSEEYQCSFAEVTRTGTVC